MNIVNKILVLFLALMIVLPIIIIPLVLLYNKITTIKERELDNETTEKNLDVFIRLIKFGPLTKYDEKFERLEKTFKKVYKTKDIPFDKKLKLYNILIKKGCNPSNIQCNKKSR